MLNSFKDYLTVIASFTALVLSIHNYQKGQTSSVNDYFKHGDSNEQKNIRKNVYSDFDNGVEIKYKVNDENISKLISFYEFWGLMYKKKYLPSWTFDNYAGNVVNKIYNISKSYIDLRRQISKEDGTDLNSSYGSTFEYLVIKINKRNKRKLLIKNIINKLRIK